jgi:hypothetical protein
MTAPAFAKPKNLIVGDQRREQPEAARLAMQEKASIDFPHRKGRKNSSPVLPITIAVAWMLTAGRSCWNRQAKKG